MNFASFNIKLPQTYCSQIGSIDFIISINFGTGSPLLHTIWVAKTDIIKELEFFVALAPPLNNATM